MNTYVFVRKLAAIGLMLLGFCTASLARPILDYPALDQDGLNAAPLEPPQSAFHAWETVRAEAARMVEGWASEPASLAWTRLQLGRYIKHKMMPTRGARGLALVHVAMHDALELARQRGLDASEGRLALSMAAAQVLGYLFVAEEKAFDRLAFSIAAQQTGRTPETLPPEACAALRLGLEVGQRVVRHAESDGAQRGWNGLRLQYYGEGRYYGPGTWEPTPPYFYFPPDEPFAPLWKPWTLARASEFRPRPPAYGSQRYVHDLQEVVNITQAISAEQVKIARFWVDGHGSVTPPGHWNQIAIDEALRAKLNDQAATRLFAQLNIALADAFIAVWDTKYHYWTARPITSARTVLGLNLKPTLLTPPFPSYVSGHAAFSGAAAQILGAQLPDRAVALSAMAEEAAHSRLLGGIHFRHDNDDGLRLGRQVAEKVLGAQFWQ